MERRPLPAVNGSWGGPSYGSGSAPHPPRFRHEAPHYPPANPVSLPREATPRVYPPDGGLWEDRAPHKAGPHGRSEQTDSWVESYREPPPQYGGPQGMSQVRPQGMSQVRPPLPDIFPHVGAIPAMPPCGPGLPGVGSQPPPPHMHRANQLYGGLSSDGRQSPVIRNDSYLPIIPLQRAPVPPQGVMPYRAPREGPLLLLPPPGRPLHIIPASPQETASEHRRERQDMTQRPTHPQDTYHPGERQRPERIPDERRDPMYVERPLPGTERPDLFLHSGLSTFRGPDPAPLPYCSSSGRPPPGFHRDIPPDLSHLQLPYQNEGAYNVKARAVPDAVHYRAPSPGIQQYPTQPPQNPPQQGHYPLPPIQGNLPGPAYALHPPVGSFFGGPLKEDDSELPRFHSNHPHQLTPQGRPHGLDPPMPLGLVTVGSHLEHNAPFPQPKILDGPRDPNLLLQHGSPFVSQHAPPIMDNSVYLDKQTDLKKGEPVDKEVFAQWLSGFLSQPRKKPATKPDAVENHSVAEARELIYGALGLVSQLDALCHTLESCNKAGEPWTQDYAKAAHIRVDLEKRLKMLERPGYIQGVKRKLDRLCKKRLRGQRRRQSEEEEKKAAAERFAEKEASIDLWRMECIQKVEEKKRERELKTTADHVLGEVRKKKNDVKKMLDVLKSLEKLRKLRKEAAGRKGVCPPLSADETFTNHINRLRTLVRKRGVLYDAEEKTLNVILEGEQEDERQRKNDQKLKKEKEKILQKQRELDSLLFGDTERLPSLHPHQPFRQYYLQAEHSVVSLVQIRDQKLMQHHHVTLRVHQHSAPAFPEKIRTNNAKSGNSAPHNDFLGMERSLMQLTLGQKQRPF